MLLILHLSGGLHDTYVCQIKGASFFRPTSDVNISETVYSIYLKINVVRGVASGDSLHLKVNRINPSSRAWVLPNEPIAVHFYYF